MSWRVEDLLLNRNSIKSKCDTESDEYNDLLLVEKKIDELVFQKRITDDELHTIYVVTNIGTFKDAQKFLSKNRLTISTQFSKICAKISFELGGIFTDDGYIDYMKEKYLLTGEEIEKLRTFITSKYRHKIPRGN